MMYLLRGAVILFSSGVLIYLASSLLLALLWKLQREQLISASSRTLLAIRLAPLVLASGVSLLLVLPSYLGFEPLGAQEDIGAYGAVTAGLGLAVLLLGVWRAISAWKQSARFVAQQVVEPAPTSSDSLPGAQWIADSVAGPLVVGIHHPTLMLPHRLTEVLSEPELRAAIRHESAHVRRRDNLKKLLLHAAPFPFLSGLNEAWTRAAELDADELAVHDEQEALDLASALLKVARLRTSVAVPSTAMSLVPQSGAPLAMRVERLLDWNSRNTASSQKLPAWAGTVLVVLMGAALNYGPILSRIHDLTEHLLR